MSFKPLFPRARQSNNSQRKVFFRLSSFQEEVVPLAFLPEDNCWLATTGYYSDPCPCPIQLKATLHRSSDSFIRLKQNTQMGKEQFSGFFFYPQ